MNELPACMDELAALTEAVLQQTAASHDTLAVRFRTVLQEQREALGRLIPVVRGDEFAMEAVRTDLSIVYHDHEIVDVDLRSWVRHLRWSGDPRLSIAEEAAARSKQMRGKLERIAALLEQRFSHDKLKYVVPSFYDHVIR